MPGDIEIEEKEHEKVVKYQDLAREIQSNPDKVLASVLCQSEDFIRTRTLSGLTFLQPCMCEVGLCYADPKHHV